MKRNHLGILLSAVIALCLAGSAVADPIPGRDILKFSQEPLYNLQLTSVAGQTEIFNGHDELSTAYSVFNAANEIVGYQGEFMADDFADRFNSPVVHVKWWGSYLNKPTNIPQNGVQKFLISFEEDIPANPDAGINFSRPGQPLLNQIVTLDADGVLKPNEGTFTERLFWPTSVDGPIYEYNAELHLDKEFPQKAGTVYWLKIVALVDALPDTDPVDLVRWGWHNRDYTKNDPLAPPPPVLLPGERRVGFIPTANGDVPIWHFQDDAVNGTVNVRFNPEDPMSRIMPEVGQSVIEPQRYRAPDDGPSLIAQYSKDLAFQLFTVPEPSGALLGWIGLAGCGWLTGRRRQG